MRLLCTKSSKLVQGWEIIDRSKGEGCECRSCKASDPGETKRKDYCYVMLSHRWENEILEKDLPLLAQVRGGEKEHIYFEQQIDADVQKKWTSLQKALNFCAKARKHGYAYVWIDSCCIEQNDPAKVSESINSMFRWYSEAAACYIFLSEYDQKSQIKQAVEDIWFTRGWTLQELVASKRLLFYDKNWNRIASYGWPEDHNDGFIEEICRHTHIDRDVLGPSGETVLDNKSIACRMSWFKGRTTTMPEDSAYCLMGIFSVHMPVMYGEGKERAFRRLQEEIIRYSDDQSIFIWKLPPGHDVPPRAGLLAPSPECFVDCGYVRPGHDTSSVKPYQMTNKGLAIDLRLLQLEDCIVATPNCEPVNNTYLGFYVQYDGRLDSQVCSRRRCDELVRVMNAGRLTFVYVKQPIRDILSAGGPKIQDETSSQTPGSRQVSDRTFRH